MDCLKNDSKEYDNYIDFVTEINKIRENLNFKIAEDRRKFGEIIIFFKITDENNIPQDAIRLFGQNKFVDAYNEKKISEMPGAYKKNSENTMTTGNRRFNIFKKKPGAYKKNSEKTMTTGHRRFTIFKKKPGAYKKNSEKTMTTGHRRFTIFKKKPASNCFQQVITRSSINFEPKISIPTGRSTIDTRPQSRASRLTEGSPYTGETGLVQSALADLTKFQELEFPEVVVLGSDCHKEDWDLDTDCTFCGLPRCNPPPPIYRPVDDLGRVLCAFIDLLISPSAHAQTRAVIEDTLEKSVNP
ncbi:unnamed protein product [Trichogramma brassicae]|uniref:Uncharacterized protein n=1 Tax=Trichogramma brassicae TaxID=86971 RepID=A0A6H5IDL0_9HYME|nr:unnamed protein product [Trichogramma brassicae]